MKSNGGKKTPESWWCCSISASCSPVIPSRLHFLTPAHTTLSLLHCPALKNLLQFKCKLLFSSSSLFCSNCASFHISSFYFHLSFSPSLVCTGFWVPQWWLSVYVCWICEIFHICGQPIRRKISTWHAIDNNYGCLSVLVWWFLKRKKNGSIYNNNKK